MNSKRTSSGNRRTIVDFCIGIFSKNNNEPMYVEQIYSAMRQRHWKTSGKTPKQTIASKLWGDYRFVKIGPNTFQLDYMFHKRRMRRYET